MKAILSFFLDRLQEKSTWMGIVSLLSVLRWEMTPAETEDVVEAGVAIASLLNMLWPESKK